MRDHFSRRWRLAVATLFLPAGVLAALIVGGGSGAAAATAATALTVTTSVTTSSTTTTAPAPVPVSECVGHLALATPTSTDPHLLSYTFHCNGPVTAYSVIVSRPGQAYDEIDDFNTAGNVLDPSTGVQSTKESFLCSGAIPGSGINCLIGTPATSADPYTFIEGQFDTTTPFCPTLPAHAKPGTKPSPLAVAYLVVNDRTGEQVGPWLFQFAPKCPAVKAVPKPKAAKA